MKDPWTFAELQRILPYVKRDLAAIEAEFTNARPLPAMVVDEVLDFMNRLMDLASKRALTSDECFLHGQLMAVFENAVQARMLGLPGRYLVLDPHKQKVFFHEYGKK